MTFNNSSSSNSCNEITVTFFRSNRFNTDNEVSSNAKILELGCGEGRDAIFLLDKNYDVLAIDYSNTVIEKCKELSNYNYNDKFKQFDIINDKS